MPGSKAARHHMSGNGGARPIVESIRTLERDTEELFVAIEQLSESVNEALRDQMDRRPYAALGGAFVAGYVLGGGLSFRLATLVAAAIGRMTLSRVVGHVMAGAPAH